MKILRGLLLTVATLAIAGGCFTYFILDTLMIEKENEMSEAAGKPWRPKRLTNGMAEPFAQFITGTRMRIAANPKDFRRHRIALRVTYALIIGGAILLALEI